MPRRKKYDKRVTVWVTTAMYNNLVRIAGYQRDVARLIRQYIREGLDRQAEIAGSRRYFTGRFRDAVHLQRLELRWFLTVLLVLISQSLSFVILAVHPDMPGEEQKMFSGPALFRTAPTAEGQLTAASLSGLPSQLMMVPEQSAAVAQ
jgi:hypothetical protein